MTLASLALALALALALVGVGATIGAAGVASAEERGLPVGHWELGHGQAMGAMCLDVVDAHHLRLTFYDREAEDWKPILVEARYVLRAQKFGDYHTTATVEEVRRKGISRCRKYVVNETLPSTHQLDVEMKPGTTLHLTLVFSCSERKERVQLCLHHDAQGTRDPPAVTCRVLERDEPSCPGQPPAIDGAQINRPPDPPRR